MERPRTALIGHTGFVGGNLARQHEFDDCFNSANIESIRGRAYDRLVCAGARAEKWRANRDPETDRAGIERLIAALGTVEAGKVILISTVDVYPVPAGVDESTPIDAARLHPYGRHRLELEQFVASRFDALIVRLPGLFGPGLKKNAVYDLLHGNQLDAIHAGAIFQFYHLAHLWKDLRVAVAAGLDLLNMATGPVSVEEVAREAFGIAFTNRPPAATPARYDMRTRHAPLFGAAGHYVYDRRAVLEELREFVRAEREAGRPGETT